MLVLSAPALASEISCSSSYCYGNTQSSRLMLVLLQDTANAVAAKLGLKDRIGVDGKIGQQTADLVNLIAVSYADTEGIRGYWASSFKEIAADASTLLAILKQLASGQQQPTGTGPVLPTSTGSKPPSAMLPDVLVTSTGLAPPVRPSSGSVQPVLVPQVPTPFIIAGALGAVALVIGGVAVALRRKRSSATVAGTEKPDPRWPDLKTIRCRFCGHKMPDVGQGDVCYNCTRDRRQRHRLPESASIAGARTRKVSKHQIVGAEIVKYEDSGQTIAYIKWGDGSSTTGSPRSVHMKALLDRARREKIKVQRDTRG